MEIVVLFKADQPVTRDAWQEVMDGQGLPASLPPDFDVTGEEGGFAPVGFRGEQAGFEFYRGPADRSILKQARSRRRGFDQAASFIWGGDLNEMGAAVCASAALAVLTGGVLYFPQDGDVFAGAEAVAWAMEAVNAV